MLKNRRTIFYLPVKRASLLFFSGLLIIFSSCAPGVRQPERTASSSPSPVVRATPTVDNRQLTGELEEGRRLYISLGCISCHGGIGEGGTGTTLRGTPLTLKEVQDQIRTPSGMMPSYGPDKITDEQIKVIYSYIKSLEIIK